MLGQFDAPPIKPLSRPRSARPIRVTAEACTTVLKDSGAVINTDGKARWVDNVFVERLRRSVKHEDVSLRVYETPAEPRVGSIRCLQSQNARRRHSALDRRTPDALYFEQAIATLAVYDRRKISLTAVPGFRGPFIRWSMRLGV